MVATTVLALVDMNSTSPASSPKSGLVLASVASPRPRLVADAKRSRDPTETGRVRAAFRKAAQQRLWRLRAQLRVAIVDHDVLGLAGATLVAHSPQHLRLLAFDEWFVATAVNALCGKWAQPFIEQAWLQGSEDALREGVDNGWAATPEGGSATLSQLAQQEIRGIVNALVQNVGRVAAASLHINKRLAYRNLSKTFDKIGKLRLNAMANTLVVKAYNQAKLVTYKHNGVMSVGIIPEMIPAPHSQLHDAKKRFPKRKWGYGPGVRRFAERTMKRAGLGEEQFAVITADDDRVCDICDSIAAGSPYDFDEAMEKIPAHVNCRCVFVPW